MIVAHHEKLLTIDLFENTEKTVDCDLYDLKNDTLAIHFGTNLSLYNQKLQLIKSYEVPFSKKVLLSEDGKMCGILSFDKELFIFTKDSQIFHRKDVFSFYISKKYLVLKERGCIKILDVNTFNELKTFTEISFCSLMGEVVLLWKSKVNEIIIFKDEIIFKKTFDEISKVECKSDDKGNILVLITSKYVSNNYYGHDTLYFFDILLNKLTKLNVEYPPLFYDFKDNKILVVSGYQPSQAYIFDYKLKLIKQFPKGIRNRMFFNKQNTLVAFCGFDNLSGNIEILNIDSLEVLTKFKIKGASLFDWSPNGSYFIVSTTNYMKVDNGVIMFDYYGRQIKQKNFGSLVKSEWIGEKEEFVVLKRPEKLLIEKENVYKLPTFDLDDKFSPKKSDKMKKGNGKLVKKENNNNLTINKPRDYEDVKKELEEVKRIKEKREKGENLSVNELNVLLKEAQLLNEIEKYENK